MKTVQFVGDIMNIMDISAQFAEQLDIQKYVMHKTKLIVLKYPQIIMMMQRVQHVMELDMENANTIIMVTVLTLYIVRNVMVRERL